MSVKGDKAMKYPKPAEYYEFIYKSYRHKNRNSCHQYRINGKIVNDEVYYDSRMELLQKGGWLVDSRSWTINKDTEVTTTIVLLKK